LKSVKITDKIIIGYSKLKETLKNNQAIEIKMMKIYGYLKFIEDLFYNETIIYPIFSIIVFFLYNCKKREIH